MLTADERARIATAIQDAEAGTSGEIVAVYARASDDYYGIGLAWAAMAALFAPWPMIYFTVWPVWLIYVVQIAVFVVAALAFATEPLRHWIIPGRIKERRAHRSAVEQFLAQGMHTTKGRTGVLIYVSAFEHYAEVIADDGIYDLAPRETWQQIVDTLTSQIAVGETLAGFEGAIAQAGVVLAEHFPPGADESNELPNHLIVID